MVHRIGLSTAQYWMIHHIIYYKAFTAYVNRFWNKVNSKVFSCDNTYSTFVTKILPKNLICSSLFYGSYAICWFAVFRLPRFRKIIPLNSMYGKMATVFLKSFVLGGLRSFGLPFRLRNRSRPLLPFQSGWLLPLRLSDPYLGGTKRSNCPLGSPPTLSALLR